MKMARASKEEWQRLMDFANAYEELTNQWGIAPTFEQLGELLNKYDPQFFRTVFGYATLVDNFCNPADNCLALKPEIEKIFLDAKYELTGGGFPI